MFSIVAAMISSSIIRNARIFCGKYFPMSIFFTEPNAHDNTSSNYEPAFGKQLRVDPGNINCDFIELLIRCEDYEVLPTAFRLPNFQYHGSLDATGICSRHIFHWFKPNLCLVMQRSSCFSSQSGILPVKFWNQCLSAPTLGNPFEKH